jgi:hypothetical protein
MHNKQYKERERLLLVFGATIEIAHVHSAEGVSHTACALCATAHAVISPATPATVPLAARQTTAPVADLQPAFARRVSDFSLYTRPPPVAIAFS